MTADRVLIVDDEPAIRFGIGEYLRAAGYHVDEADSVRTAMGALKNALPDAILADYNLGDGNGLDIVRRVVALDRGVPIIVLTAHGSIDLAVQAIKEGAEQFLTKPVELPALAVILERAIGRQRGRKKGLAQKKKDQRDQIDPFSGKSSALERLADEARRLLPSDRPIFIHGETGSGKGVLARWIHDNGPRANEAFVDLNCAGFSRAAPRERALRPRARRLHRRDRRKAGPVRDCASRDLVPRRGRRYGTDHPSEAPEGARGQTLPARR